jgi:hypothetical protein
MAHPFVPTTPKLIQFHAYGKFFRAREDISRPRRHFFVIDGPLNGKALRFYVELRWSRLPANMTPRCWRACAIIDASAETIEKALTGSYRAEHLFALEQTLALYDAYHDKVSAFDARIEAVLKELSIDCGRKSDSLLPPRRPRTDQMNGLPFDLRAALFALLGKDLTQIDGLGPYLSLKLIAECGDDLSAWASAKHFTSCS